MIEAAEVAQVLVNYCRDLLAQCESSGGGMVRLQRAEKISAMSEDELIAGGLSTAHLPRKALGQALKDLKAFIADFRQAIAKEVMSSCYKRKCEPCKTCQREITAACDDFLYGIEKSRHNRVQCVLEDYPSALQVTRAALYGLEDANDEWLWFEKNERYYDTLLTQDTRISTGQEAQRVLKQIYAQRDDYVADAKQLRERCEDPSVSQTLRAEMLARIDISINNDPDSPTELVHESVRESVRRKDSMANYWRGLATGMSNDRGIEFHVMSTYYDQRVLAMRDGFRQLVSENTDLTAEQIKQRAIDEIKQNDPFHVLKLAFELYDNTDSKSLDSSLGAMVDFIMNNKDADDKSFVNHFLTTFGLHPVLVVDELVNPMRPDKPSESYVISNRFSAAARLVNVHLPTLQYGPPRAVAPGETPRFLASGAEPRRLSSDKTRAALRTPGATPQPVDFLKQRVANRQQRQRQRRSAKSTLRPGKAA